MLLTFLGTSCSDSSERPALLFLPSQGEITSESTRQTRREDNNWLPFVYTCRNNRSFEQRCKRSVLDLDRAARDISRGGREEIERSKEGLLTESGLTVRKTASRDEITTRARHKIRHATVELNTVPEWRSERASSAINGRFRRCHAANGRDRASTYVGRSRATIARTRWCPMCEYNVIPRPEKCPRKRGVRDNARKDKVRSDCLRTNKKYFERWPCNFQGEQLTEVDND